MSNDNPDLVAQYGIRQAPTLVIVSGDKVETVANLSNIKAYTEKR